MSAARQIPFSALTVHPRNSVPFITNMSGCLGSDAVQQAAHVMVEKLPQHDTACCE